MEPSTPQPTPPSQHRLALLIFLGVYPLVTCLMMLIGPLTAGWRIWQRTLVLVPIVVLSMVYVIIPFIHRRFARFLRGERVIKPLDIPKSIPRKELGL